MSPRGCRSLLALTCIAAAGCDDVSLNLEPAPRRTMRAAPEPIRVRRPATRPGPTAASRPARVEPSYYQLVLTRDAAPARTAPGLTYARLACAAPRAAAELLGMLYVPSGSSGSSTRHVLIYPTAAECAAAAEHVALLDQAAARSSTNSAADFACATAMWYQAAAEPGERARFSPVVERFEALADNADIPRDQRWAARMLGAGIRTDRLGELRRPVELYARAADDAVPGSLEHLTSLYRRGRVLFQAGETRQARSVLETLIGQFSAMRQTEPFERARRLLREMNQQR